MDGKMNVLNVQLDDYTAKDAMKAVAKDRGISKREVYKMVKIDGETS